MCPQCGCSSGWGYIEASLLLVTDYIKFRMVTMVDYFESYDYINDIKGSLGDLLGESNENRVLVIKRNGKSLY